MAYEDKNGTERELTVVGTPKGFLDEDDWSGDVREDAPAAIVRSRLRARVQAARAPRPQPCA